jgi:hypothetical protein
MRAGNLKAWHHTRLFAGISMRFRHLLLGMLVALPLALAGCKVNTINSFNPAPAQVRVANVIPDATVAISVDGTPAFAGVAFEAVTTYKSFDANPHNFGLRVDGTSSDIISAEFNIAGAQNYTLVPFDTIAFPSLLMLPDVIQDTGNTTAAVRFVLAAAGLTYADIYVTAPDAIIDNIDPTISYLAFGSAGGYTAFAPGSYRTRITAAGTKVVLYDSGPYTLVSHAVSNAIIYTRGSNELLNVMLLDTAGGTVIVNNTLSKVKALNASPGMANVDFLYDSVAVFSGIAFGNPTLYSRVLSEPSVTLAFQASATPGAIIAQTTGTIQAATDATVLLLGFPGAQSVKIYPDNNLPPPASTARVRFINASPDAPPLDVLINDVRTVTALKSGDASVYVPLVVGTYTIKFVDPVTGTVSPVLAGVALNQDVYTVYAVGANSAMSAIYSIDR